MKRARTRLQRAETFLLKLPGSYADLHLRLWANISGSTESNLLKQSQRSHTCIGARSRSGGDLIQHSAFTGIGQRRSPRTQHGSPEKDHYVHQSDWIGAGLFHALIGGDGESAHRVVVMYDNVHLSPEDSAACQTETFHASSR
jgi:hypothetical protein